MAKKNQPEAHPTGPIAPGPTPQSADHIANAAIAELAGQLEIVARRRAELAPGSFDRDLANTAASLARAVTSLKAELRAGEKARTYTARSLPPELVLEHLRGLSEERRAHIIQELVRMTDTSSVLG